MRIKTVINSNDPMKRWMIIVRLLSSFLLSFSLSHAAAFNPQFSPQQLITYWQKYIIPADEDIQVSLAHKVLDQLLKAWDKSRVAPDFYVVESQMGSWAASLEDGSILLSRAALGFVMQVDQALSTHRLAFILAHEMAHQRSDDLWQQKFFRLAGNEVPEIKQRLMEGLDVSGNDIVDLERREAQADADGLILMALVGYDPVKILQDRDFFTTWAEAIWGNSCLAINDKDDIFEACSQAKSRASRAYTKLKDVAAKSVYFELAIQAYVMGDYQRSREYFTVFGREYPYGVVHANIGLSYLAEALQIKERLIVETKEKEKFYYFPLILSADSPFDENKLLALENFGTSRTLSIKKRRKVVQYNIEQAINALEQALQINSNNPQYYLHLAICYLIEENPAMARGILVTVHGFSHLA